MQPLLEGVPLLRTHDLEAMRAFYAVKATGFEPIRPTKAVSTRPYVRVNGLYLANLWFGYVEFGLGAALRLSPHSSSFRGVDQKKNGGPAPGPLPLGDYYLHIPLRGQIEAEISGQVIDCSRTRGVVISPGVEQVVRTRPDTARLSLSIRGDALNRHLAALLGGAPAKPLRFDPAVQLQDKHGRSLADMLRWTAGDFDLDGGILANPLIASQFESFVMSWLLLAQPSNYSDAIHGRNRPLAPRDIRRVIDYIHGNLAQPMTLSDLVNVSGVPGRTLLKHFRDCHGVAPMRYLRNLRMQRVRDELAAGTAERVGAVAMHWGFEHAGRFSIEYRRRFGESPSMTLARGRSGR